VSIMQPIISQTLIQGIISRTVDVEAPRSMVQPVPWRE
jgi:hypothetical protein